MEPNEEQTPTEESVAALFADKIRIIARKEIEAMLPDLKNQIKAELREEFEQKARLGALEVQEERSRDAVGRAGL